MTSEVHGYGGQSAHNCLRASRSLQDKNKLYVMPVAVCLLATRPSSCIGSVRCLLRSPDVCVRLSEVFRSKCRLSSYLPTTLACMVGTVMVSFCSSMPSVMATLSPKNDEPLLSQVQHHRLSSSRTLHRSDPSYCLVLLFLLLLLTPLLLQCVY